MDPVRASIPTPLRRNEVSTALLVATLLWLATGIASRFRSDGEDWEGVYVVFSALLLAAAAASAVAITVYTSKPKPNPWSVPRFAAIAVSTLAVASTMVAWAFLAWSVLLAAGFAALAGTGRSESRDATWLSGALLAGLLVALIGVWAEIGPPGEYGDHSQAQGWGVTVACALATAALGVLARRAQRPPAVTGVALPT